MEGWWCVRYGDALAWVRQRADEGMERCPGVRWSRRSLEPGSTDTLMAGSVNRETFKTIRDGS